MAGAQASTCIHHAPAGRYNSLLDAGRSILLEKYPGFLEGSSHALIPPIFVNEHPEEVGLDGKIKAGTNAHAHIKQFEGAVTNKFGKDFETLIYQRFEQVFHPTLVDSPYQDCHILWKGLEVSTYKLHAFRNEYPKLEPRVLDFLKNHTKKTKKKNAITLGEADIVVLVKNVGLVVIEVKRPQSKLASTHESLEKKSRKQSDRMAELFSIVFEGCSTNSCLPVVKVVVFGISRTPFIMKDNDVWFLFDEATQSVENFQTCWDQILQELRKLKRPNHATPKEFEDFAAIMSGLWSMEQFYGPVYPVHCKRKFYTFL